MWPFVWLLHLLCFFFWNWAHYHFFLRLAPKIPYALVIYPPLQRQSVTGTLLPLSKWLQWSHYLHYLHTRYQEKIRLLITYILLKRFQLSLFSVLVIWAMYTFSTVLTGSLTCSSHAVFSFTWYIFSTELKGNLTCSVFFYPKKERKKSFIQYNSWYAVRSENRTKFDLPCTCKTHAEGLNMLRYVVYLTSGGKKIA